jgi:uncharacterized membrane protein
MKSTFRVLKATLVGGLLFMVPVILVLVVLRHGVDMAKKIVKPVVVAYAPVHSVAGVTVATLAAAGLLALIALGLGLFSQTALGRRIRDWLENTILGRVPGYAILKGLVGDTVGVDAGDVAPALAWIEESWVYAFVMEVHPDGFRTVFVPAAPSPLTGAIYFLPEDRLRPLDLPVASVMKAIHRLGVGSAALLAGRLSAKPPG